MLQIILIGILLAGAAFYLGRLVYLSFTSSSCSAGCGSCGVVDTKSQTIEKKKLA